MLSLTKSRLSGKTAHIVSVLVIILITFSITAQELEDKMEQALVAVQLIFYLMGGLGLFFLGVGVLSFVDVYKKKNA